MKTPINLIVGASGSGKDYIVDKLCNRLEMTRVDSRTTRKSRGAGDKHLFVSEEQADAEFDLAIAKTIFDRHRYYVLKEDLAGKDLYIIDPRGVESMRDSGIPHITIYIKSPWYMRAYNMRKRGDKIKNIIRRLINDAREFKGFSGDVNLGHSNELYDMFAEEENLTWNLQQATD